jgi:hypothetical protein
MKALHDSTQNLQAQSVATDIAAWLVAIFEQYPMLCGFSVQEHSTLTADRAMVQLQGGLCLADVAVNTPPGFRVSREFSRQIADALIELMEELPEVIGFLSGRTFARTFH